MLLMLAFYAGNVKLPLHLPGGFVALGVGIALAAAGSCLGYAWFVPPPLADSYAPTLQLPVLQQHLWRHLASPSFLQTVAVVVPM